MTVFGFCLAENTDVEIDPARRCQADNSLTIPPSFGSKDQRFVDGAWQPEIERPANYQYRPKVYASQVIAPPVSAPCQQCDLTFSYAPRGGDPPRYCSPQCKGASARARRREARASV